MTPQLRSRGYTYTLDMLRDEARALVDQRIINRQQPIYALCRFVSKDRWKCVEMALEADEFLMRDRIIDLLAQETWIED